MKYSNEAMNRITISSNTKQSIPDINTYLKYLGQRQIYIGTIAGEYLISIPDNQVWIIESCRYTFTAGATVGDRRTGIRYLDENGNLILFPRLANNGTATQSCSIEAYIGSPSLFTAPAATAELSYLPLPNMKLFPNMSFGTGTIGILSGDTYTNLAIYVRTFKYTQRGN